jgi:hypothetical protein
VLGSRLEHSTKACSRVIGHGRHDCSLLSIRQESNGLIGALDASKMIK